MHNLPVCYAGPPPFELLCLAHAAARRQQSEGSKTNQQKIMNPQNPSFDMFRRYIEPEFSEAPEPMEPPEPFDPQAQVKGLTKQNEAKPANIQAKSQGNNPPIPSVDHDKAHWDLSFRRNSRELGVPIYAPAGVDVIANVHKAANMRANNPGGVSAGGAMLLAFKDMVANGRPWDFKKDYRNSAGWKRDVVADFGNWHYGLVGAAMGLTLPELLRFAGYAQWRAGTSNHDWSSPVGASPYGDDPIDQIWIKRGFDAYRALPGLKDHGIGLLKSFKPVER